ncbi:2Fe-2S iron-sulfur cluster-binding protein [Nonomuraea diastatica]|uniref:2Fe-2S iron-sulfur cluster binding domain-containing protein n=1 Tax=Nonomuraea diastatica TaxID=1848329 RepID=A0A4R4X5X9_9ACTN|nr:2Fe-2S iron-sulfur cluster-binding protein [Nonomuraea diastatica]TDD25790.1 2Fe-2S iron-sulfur cluster binding domain-containing protein [Nonomuraea diastatica]
MEDAEGRDPSRVDVVVRVNGDEHALSVDPRTTLLDLLREKLAVTGPKKGCDHGQCGACTVLLDGRRVLSCLALTVAVQDRAVVTVEGLGGDVAERLRREFVRHDGFQCGFCTPGQLCSAVGLLDEIERGVPSARTENLEAVPVLDGGEIRERMSGNLCRCGAYANIVRAIAAARG